MITRYIRRLWLDWGSRGNRVNPITAASGRFDGEKGKRTFLEKDLKVEKFSGEISEISGSMSGSMKKDGIGSNLSIWV